MTSVVWTPEMEVSLFYAMIDHKPVGENKNFHMIFIYEKFNNLSEKKLSIEQIWQHLNTLYNLNGLDANEIEAFPNEENEFFLPDFDTSSNNSEDLEASNKSTTTTSSNKNKQSTSEKKPQSKSTSKKK